MGVLKRFVIQTATKQRENFFANTQVNGARKHTSFYVLKCLYNIEYVKDRK